MAAATIWDQAIGVILGLLNGPGSPAHAYRDRFEAVGSSEIAFNLFSTSTDLSEECAQDSLHAETVATVRLSLAGLDGNPTATPPMPSTPASVVASPLVVFAWRVIRLDPTLGQLVLDVTPEKVETGYVDKSSSDQVCVDITFRVKVEVDRNDPSINKTYGSQLAVPN